MFAGDHWGDDCESVNTPKAWYLTDQRNSQVVMTSTALSRWRWQYRHMMPGGRWATLSRLDREVGEAGELGAAGGRKAMLLCAREL